MSPAGATYHLQRPLAPSTLLTPRFFELGPLCTSVECKNKTSSCKVPPYAALSAPSVLLTPCFLKLGPVCCPLEV